MANVSTSDDSNYPLSYAVRPDRVEFDQFLLRIERISDTVQTDHVDCGFHFDNLYGYDPMLFYGDLYVPGVAEGMIFIIASRPLR